MFALLQVTNNEDHETKHTADPIVRFVFSEANLVELRRHVPGGQGRPEHPELPAHVPGAHKLRMGDRVELERPDQLDRRLLNAALPSRGPQLLRVQLLLEVHGGGQEPHPPRERHQRDQDEHRAHVRELSRHPAAARLDRGRAHQGAR